MRTVLHRVGPIVLGLMFFAAASIAGWWAAVFVVSVAGLVNTGVSIAACVVLSWAAVITAVVVPWRVRVWALSALVVGFACGAVGGSLFWVFVAIPFGQELQDFG
ncbi:hypothetical protein QSJ19_03090 [Gordonia sp. ABSL11-1]|uniref:hypothetical protein n=1 Tax=Gordonia sp. ABSL11-1 TaxID=3053924 RepID=UPI002573A9BB|nr:hypothetical protein [Gordonia sp. ABSL11-1]MDL9944585.1 hypothetical protein [Gordonia sp. ABSL11-1]